MHHEFGKCTWLPILDCKIIHPSIQNVTKFGYLSLEILLGTLLEWLCTLLGFGSLFGVSSPQGCLLCPLLLHALLYLTVVKVNMSFLDTD